MMNTIIYATSLTVYSPLHQPFWHAVTCYSFLIACFRTVTTNSHLLPNTKSKPYSTVDIILDCIFFWWEPMDEHLLLHQTIVPFTSHIMPSCWPHPTPFDVSPCEFHQSWILIFPHLLQWGCTCASPQVWLWSFAQPSVMRQRMVYWIRPCLFNLVTYVTSICFQVVLISLRFKGVWGFSSLFSRGFEFQALFLHGIPFWERQHLTIKHIMIIL